MRIAGLTPEPTGSVNPIYRSALPMLALAARGHGIYLCEGEEQDPRRLLDFDAVCIWRACDGRTHALARMLSDAGVAIVWDDDDHVEALPRHDSKYKGLGGGLGLRRYGQQVAAMMRLADLVTSPSRVLCQRFEEISGTPTRQLENYLPDGYGDGSDGGARGDGTVTLGWVAGQEHRVDIDRLSLHPLVEGLLDELPELRLLTVGIKFGIRSERYEYFERVEHHELPAVLSRVDVGLAPLADVRYNQARSNVKLKEYAANGVAWLASPIGPYAGLGEQQGGRLVPDDGWADAVRALVRDGRARRKLAKRGAKWAKGETIGRNVHRWEAAIEEAVALARERDARRRAPA